MASSPVLAGAPRKWAFVCGLIISAAATAHGQQPDGGFPELSLPQEFGLDNPTPEAKSPPVNVTAKFQLNEGSRQGQLLVQATIEPLWHLYSVTQKPGGPLPTVIKITGPAGANVLAPFQPDQPPKIKEEPKLYPNLKIEEHEGQVTWSAPIELPESADPEQMALAVTLEGLVCRDTGCLPVFAEVTANFAGYLEDQVALGFYRPEDGHVEFQGHVEPSVVQPGATLKLFITATPEADWHIYAYAAQDPDKISKPTLIVLNDRTGWTAGPVVASAAPIEKETGLADEPISRYHEEPISWTIEIPVPADAAAGDYDLTGQIGYQMCTSSGCDRPMGATFAARVTVGSESLNAPAPLSFGESDYTTVAQLAAAATSPDAAAAGPTLDLDALRPSTAENETPFLAAIGYALLGGFILNFMPCVLPVIGLKVMAFVQQAGESRSRILMLNIWYCLGLLSIFMVLATLAVVFNFGWGQQAQFGVFNITMTAVVFTMGLSFLGVWEIPIPGFVGTGKTAEFAEKEGVLAAFVKGCVTTILAVPCSGPGLAVALAWCAGKPAPLVYLIFAFMGLGMALPYLVIGVNPKLVAFLPKPGPWMEKFKQILGFVLLGTVVFFFTYIDWELMLPTLAFLFGLWAACWWIGQTPFTATGKTKALNWTYAIVFSALIGWFSFSWLGNVMTQRYRAAVDKEIAERQVVLATDDEPDGEVDGEHISWQPFSMERLQSEVAAGRTVLVDFTADW